MASRLFSWLKILGNERIVIAGSFAPNGSSALSAASTKGRGFTVARTSAGLFTVTFADAYYDLVSGWAHLQLAAGDDKYAQLGTYSASAKTHTIRIWDISAAAETDVAANANNRVHFGFIFRNSSVD